MNNKDKRGTVKFFNKAKGFGIIQHEGSKEEIFFHVTGLLDEVIEQAEVIFDIETAETVGTHPKAVNVRYLERGDEWYKNK